MAKKKHKWPSIDPLKQIQDSYRENVHDENELPSQLTSGGEVVKLFSPPLCNAVPKTKAARKAVSLLLTPDDLCELLKVSRSTLSRMDKSGSVPGRVKIGGSVRYKRETIENWVRELPTQ